MKPHEPSRTALMIARQRAAHQLLDHGAILDDPLALTILGEDAEAVVRFATAHPLGSIGRLLVTARSRIAEDAVAGALARGMRQVVVLGAGLDTLALRNPHREAGMRIYEVDHPATQGWKRERLTEAQIALPPQLMFVAVDFEQDDLREKLAGAGLDPNAPAFFSWLGVVPYLTEEAIGSTLDYVASIPGAELVFDYVEPLEAFSEKLAELERAREEQLKKMNEPPLSRFEPLRMRALLEAHGFTQVEDADFAQIRARFGGAIEGLPQEHAGHHVVRAQR